MESRGRIFWGVALVLFGAALLAAQLGIIPFTINFALFLFGVPALMFLLAFVTDRRQWWALIPGSVLTGLTFLVFNGDNHLISGEQAGSVFLFSIGLPFLLIYVIDRRQWWALIPGGVMSVLALLPLVATRGTPGQVVAGLFFVGLAAVFGLVRLATRPNPAMAWAWWPAAILGTFGLFIVLTGTVAAELFWPLLLIGLGLLILARGYLPRRSDNNHTQPNR